MRRTGLLILVTSCATTPAPTTPPAEPLPPPITAPSGPPPEVPALDLADPKAAFDPVTYATGRAPALREALQGKNKIGLICSAGIASTADEKRVIELIASLQPKAKVLVRGRDTLPALLIERGERPTELRSEPTGQTDIFGRPTYVIKDVMLQTEWFGKARKLYGAEVMIWIDVPVLDPERSRRFRERTVGGCDLLLGELDTMRTSAGAALAPFSEHVNRELLARFGERVRPQATKWLTELSAWADPPRDRLSYEREEQFLAHQCGYATHRIVSEAVRCQSPGACPEVPSLHIDGGAWIGASPSAIYVASDCARRLGTDYLARLREVAAASARQVAGGLPAQSGARVAAAGTLSSLRAAVAKACAPARGRLAEDKRAAADAAVRSTLAILRSAGPEAGDGWIEERTERIGTGGRALQVARFRSAVVEKAERDVAAIAREASARQCRSTHDNPIAILAIDVGTSEGLYFDYLREEEIFCEGMAPVGVK